MHWLEGHGLVTDPAELERVRASRFGWLSARVTPEAADDAVVAFSCLQLWLFIFDDLMEESGAGPADVPRMCAPYLRILDLPGDPIDQGDPFAVALVEVRERIDGAGPVRLTRLRQALADTFFAACWETAYRAGGFQPSLPDYLYFRRIWAAAEPGFVMLQIADDVSVSEAELRGPGLRALERMAANALAWQNDICSYFKELRRGSLPPIGLPGLLRRRDGSGLQEAMDEAARMHNEEVRAFTELEARVAPGLSPEAARYVTGLRRWMRGNHDWAMTTGRYEVPRHFEG
jgi:5-epi-alpha-selinene synthase